MVSRQADEARSGQVGEFTLPPMQPLTCAVCGAQEWKPVYTGLDHAAKKRMRIAQCIHCGLMSQNPRRTSEVATEHYRVLDNAAAMDASTRSRNAAFTLDLARLERMTSGRRLLDVGCASGAFLCVARDRGWDVWGVEPTESCARFAQDHHGLRVQATVLRAADWGQTRFDAITMSYVLEHIPEPAAVVGEALQLLAPGGVLYATVPNCGSPQVRLRMMAGAFSGSVEADAGHMSFFSRATLRAIITAQGGREVRVRDGMGGGLLVRRLRSAFSRAPGVVLTGLDLLDAASSVARVGSTLRLWARREP